MAIIPANEKVFMVSNGTNTTYGGSAALKAMQQWYTMQDVADSVQPYKVFTALLTQSGGDNTEGIIGTPLTIGTTYKIDISAAPSGNWDFTNVGAPNNDIGTYFIATGTTANNWGTNIVLSYNTGAPVATVLENTIGNVWFTYVSDGNYLVYNSSELFTTSKTFGLITPNTNFTNTPFFSIEIGAGLTSFTQILTSDNGTFSNDLLFKTPIEIRVYN